MVMTMLYELFNPLVIKHVDAQDSFHVIGITNSFGSHLRQTLMKNINHVY